MRNHMVLLLFFLFSCGPEISFSLSGETNGRELFVSVINGDDNNEGTAEKPFKSIMAAVNVAYPSDINTVSQGTYRERISPVRGGLSDDRRIVFQAAPGERVEIKGSEVIEEWVWKQNDWSQGGTYAHNIFAGRINQMAVPDRKTPFQEPHSTSIKGLSNIPGGDNHFYNNIITSGRLDIYDKAAQPSRMAGNIFTGSAIASEQSGRRNGINSRFDLPHHRTYGSRIRRFLNSQLLPLHNNPAKKHNRPYASAHR